MKQPELQPCKFCGESAIMYKTEDGEDDLNDIWKILCTKCPAAMVGQRQEENQGHGLYPDEKEDIILAWNNTPPKETE